MERERKLNIRREELEIVAKELEEEIGVKEEVYGKKKSQEADQLRQLVSNWAVKVKNQERKTSSEKKEHNSAEEGLRLNQGSTTEDEMRLNSCRKRLPVAESFTLDDDDMF